MCSKIEHSIIEAIMLSPAPLFHKVHSFSPAGVLAGSTGAEAQDGVRDRLRASGDHGEALATGDSRGAEVRVQWRGEQVEVGVVRGGGLGTTAGYCSARNRAISGELLSMCRTS